MNTWFRKPLLYPLSYEGAKAQLTCQRVPTGARAYQGVPTGLTWGRTDRASTHRAHQAAVDRRRANECQPVPTRPIRCQRLTEHPPSTPQDQLIPTRRGKWTCGSAAGQQVWVAVNWRMHDRSVTSGHGDARNLP